MTHSACHRADRRGCSFLELQVAFALLGIALAGVVPLLVMQSKQLKAIESRLPHGQTHRLVPVTSDWARKLGAPATIEAVEAITVIEVIELSSVSSSSLDEPAQELTILALDKSLRDEVVTVRVRVDEVSDQQQSTE